MTGRAEVRGNSQPGREGRDLACVALVIALCTGCAESLIRVLGESVKGWPVGRSPDGLWLAPLIHLAWMVPVALGLGAMIGRVPQISLRVGFAVLIFFASLEMLLDRPRFHQGAALLLALGLGFQLSALAVRHRAAVVGAARRVMWVLVLVAVAFAAVTLARRWNSERRAIATLPDPPAGAPNILLLVLDTVRGQSMSLYGYPRPTTPRIAAWAARGVTFQRAFATAPWTLPSHVSMFSGEWPSRTSAGWLTRLDDARPLVAEALTARGYLTGGFIANLLYCPRQTGLARGFVHYEDFPLDWGAVALTTGIGRALLDKPWVRTTLGYYDSPSRKHAARLNRDLLRWLDTVQGRPFFAFVNYFDAHEPYLPDPALEAAWATNSTPRPFDRYRYFGHEISLGQSKNVTPEERIRERDAYDASVAGLDADIGALLSELERRGRLTNTIVIITADHGEQFGEHGLYEHGNSLYRELLQVPLVAFGPGIPAGVRVDQPVSLRDLAATFLDLAGRPDAPFPGRSLARTWTHATVDADRPMAELIGGRGKTDRTVFAGWDQFIRGDSGLAELYDLEKDPEAARNLASDSGSGPRVAAYQALLDSALGPRPVVRK